MPARKLLGWAPALGLALLCSAAPATDNGPPTPWELVAVGTGKIAVPRGWRKLDNLRPRMPVYPQGDGIGVPARDETGAPLQIGLVVEQFPAAKRPVREIMDGLVAAAKRAPGLELVGKESVEKVKLSDGTEGLLLTAEFIKGGGRRSLQMKLVVKDAASTAWVVSGHVVGGKESKWPTAGSALARWLRAHLLSLSLDEKRFDAGKLREAYRERERK